MEFNKIYNFVNVLSSRFTEHFLKKAHSVTCVDFMPSVLAVNRNAHEGCGNVKFILSDVTELDQPNHRFLYMRCVNTK